MIDSILTYILTDGDKENYYKVMKSLPCMTPVFEGSLFRPSHKPPVDGHFFVVREFTGRNGAYTERIVGVAHSEKELPDKVYSCAERYCLKKCKGGVRFFDDTKRHNLEMHVFEKRMQL